MLDTTAPTTECIDLGHTKYPMRVLICLTAPNKFLGPLLPDV